MPGSGPRDETIAIKPGGVIAKGQPGVGPFDFDGARSRLMRPSAHPGMGGNSVHSPALSQYRTALLASTVCREVFSIDIPSWQCSRRNLPIMFMVIIAFCSVQRTSTEAHHQGQGSTRSNNIGQPRHSASSEEPICG
jgi:hypothetical protein